jgi:hypothetical protein
MQLVFAPFDVHMNKQGHFASKQIANSLHKRAFLELKIQSKFFPSLGFSSQGGREVCPTGQSYRYPEP